MGSLRVYYLLPIEIVWGVLAECVLQHEGEAAAYVCRPPILCRHTRSASKHDIWEVDLPDRDSRHEYLGIQVQGLTYRCNPWEESLGNGNVPRYLMIFRFTAAVMAASGYFACSGGFVGAKGLTTVRSSRVSFPFPRSYPWKRPL